MRSGRLELGLNDCDARVKRMSKTKLRLDVYIVSLRCHASLVEIIQSG